MILYHLAASAWVKRYSRGNASCPPYCPQFFPQYAATTCIRMA